AARRLIGQRGAQLVDEGLARALDLGHLTPLVGFGFGYPAPLGPNAGRSLAANYFACAYCAYPPKSTATQGSSPTTQASWPGAIEATSPGPISPAVPSAISICIRPETQ